MKQKFTTYIYLLFCIVFSDSFLAQEIKLEITSKKEYETTLLDNINYKKQHTDSISLKNEIIQISKSLKNSGYFTHTIDSILTVNNTKIAFFSLNEKINNATIRFSSDDLFIFGSFKIENNTFSIPIEKLQSTLQDITEKLEISGNSFSKIQLKNIELKEKTLFAEINIQQSTKRIKNDVVLKGYEDFPKSFLKHYFGIKKGTVFNQEKITAISNASKNLKFIREIKPPEVLFTKDSTFLYMYLKKQQNNSFDGLVNFTSKEDGGVLFNGHIDLKLSNILNKGENFELFWNSIGLERQEFKITTQIPYIFNTAITPELCFSIYKQDSTFLTTKFNSKLFYNLSTKSKLALTYSSETSDNLNEELTNSIETFNNYFVGFQFEYAIPKNDFFFNNTFYIALNPSYGKRSFETFNSNQFKIEVEASYLWDLNIRNSIYTSNKTGHLNSDTFIDNELFRIGGAKTIRGFNEQSIFTSSYTFFNLEYRYLTSNESYFYSITDIGTSKIGLKNENLLGLGLGYLFTSNNSQINISTAIGRTSKQNFDFKDTKLIISWKNYF